MNRHDIRNIKLGDTVFIKETKITAYVTSCELIKGIWVCELKGWPGKIPMDLIEPIGNKK